MDYSVWYMGIWYLDYEYIEEGWRPVSWRWKHREVEPYANRTDLILLDIDDYYKEISRIMTANYWIFYFFYNKRRSSWNCLIIFLTNRAGSFLYFYLCKKLILFVFWVDSPLITLKWNLKHGIPIIKTIYLQPEIVILCLFSFNIFLLKLFFMYNKLFLHKTASYDEYTRLLYKIKNKKENIELFFNIVFFSFYSFKVYFLKNSLNLSKHFFCKFFYVVLNCYLIMRKEITKYPITINSLNYSWYFYKYKNSSFFITRVKNRYSILLIITRFFFFLKKKNFFIWDLKIIFTNWLFMVFCLTMLLRMLLD